MALPRLELALRSAALVLTGVTALACQRLTYEDNTGEADGDDSAGDSDGTDEDEDDTDEPSSTPPGSTAPIFECDPSSTSECPDDEKCSPVLSTSGRRNHYKCVNDDGDRLPNDECMAAPVTGQDSCPSGTACIVDDEGFGRCLDLCARAGDCGSGECVFDNIDQVRYCAPPCDPFDQMCPPGTECRRGSDRFGCRLPLTIDVGLNGEPCDTQSDTGCAGGFVCLNGGVVAGCASFSCCTPLCELSGPVCPGVTQCKPVFEDPGPGSEDVGACLIPQ